MSRGRAAALRGNNRDYVWESFMTRSYAPSSLYVAPTLVIGLGGSGVAVIRQLKSRIRQSVREIPGIIEFLAVDTEPVENMPGDERIFDREIAYLGDYNAQSVISSLDRHPHIKDWWFTDKSKIIGRVFRGARQRRAVGRLSLYARWGQFARRLDAKLLRVREIAEKEAVERRGIQVDRTGQVRVYIVASLCGGTGAGTFLDVAFRVRKQMGDDAEIVGLFVMPSVFLPDVQSRIQQQRIQGNAYAALRELNHFLAGATFDACFPDHSFYLGDGKTRASTPLQYPFNTAYLVDRDNGRENLGSVLAVRQMMAQFIYLDIITPIGKDVAAKRENLNDLASEVREHETLAIAGFVTASLVTPGMLRDYVSEMFLADFTRRRIIGADSPAVQHTAAQQAEQYLQRLRQQLDDALPASAAVSGANAALAAIFGAPAAPGPTARPRDAHPERTALEEIRQLADELLRKHGLHAVRHLADRLADGMGGLRRELEQQLQQAEQQRPQVQQPDMSSGNRVIGLFEGIFNRRQQAEQRDEERRAREQQQELLRGQQQRAAAQLDRVRMIAAAVVRLADLARVRIEGLQPAAAVGSAAASAGARLNRRSIDALVFDLVTTVGDEQEIAAPGSGRPDEPLIQRYLRERHVLDGRLSSDEEQLFSRSAALVFGLRTVEEEGALQLRPQLPSTAGAVLEQLRTEIERYVAEQFADLQELGVSDYLDWFYRQVQYYSSGSTTARNSPIDPILRLKRRCERPFLRVDESQLGTEHAFDMEPVRLVGTSPLQLQREWRHGNPDHMLADFDDFLPIDTGTPDRLDVLFATFGYKITDLADLEDFSRSYRYFMDNVGESLHIHRDWPTNMVDPLSLRKRAAGRTSVTPRTSP
jgi:hypothetical protein